MPGFGADWEGDPTYWRNGSEDLNCLGPFNLNSYTTIVPTGNAATIGNVTNVCSNVNVGGNYLIDISVKICSYTSVNDSFILHFCGNDYEFFADTIGASTIYSTGYLPVTATSCDIYIGKGLVDGTDLVGGIGFDAIPI